MLTKFATSLGALLLVAGITACSGQAGASAPSTDTTSNSSTSAASQNNAASQNGSTSPADSTSQNAGTPTGRGPNGRGPNVAGTVQSINGSTIVVQRQQDNSTATVQISSSTTIRKQDVGALSDLQPGANLIAFGQTANNVFQAQQIQLGTGQFPGRTGGNGGGNGGNGSNGGGNNGGNGNGGNGGGRPGPGGGAPGQVLAGTVDSVSGNTVTVKANDGSTTQLQLAANGRIVKTSNGTAADIQTGEFLIATGQDQGTTLDATNVTVSPAGFTGFGGGRRNATPSPTP